MRVYVCVVVVPGPLGVGGGWVDDELLTARRVAAVGHLDSSATRGCVNAQGLTHFASSTDTLGTPLYGRL